MDPVNLDHSEASVAIDPATGQQMLRIPTAKFSLTKPALEYDDPGVEIDPVTGQPRAKAATIKYFKNNAARGQQLGKDAAAAVAPGTSDVSGVIPDPGQSADNTVTQVPGAEGAMPKMFRPSFTSVAGPGANGLPQPINGAETKLGKFIHVLGASARGALAGLGQTNAAAGAQAAREVPFQMAQQPLQLAQERAQTGLLQAEQQNVNIPGFDHPIPAWLARTMGPAWIRGQATTGAAQIGANSRQNVAQTNATSRENVAQTNKRFMAVPGVGLLDTQNASGKPTLVPDSEQGVTITQQHIDDYGLPKEFLGKHMTLQQLAQLEKAQNSEETTVQGAAGPALVNKRTKKVSPLGLGNPSTANRTNSQNDAASAEQIAGTILNAAGGDPDKALKLFDQKAGKITDQDQIRLGPDIRKAIRARRTINKPQNPLDKIISGDVEGGLNDLQSNPSNP